MIKHIVMWKVNGEGAEKQDNIRKMKAALDACKNIVPGMLKYEVGIDTAIDFEPWDIAVYAEFANRAVYDAYQQHPTHLATKPVVRALRELRGAVDFEE